MSLPGKSEGVVFSPVPCEVVCYEPERVGVAFLKEAVEKPNPIRQDLQQVCHIADSLDSLLTLALDYVEKVLVTSPYISMHEASQRSKDHGTNSDFTISTFALPAFMAWSQSGVTLWATPLCLPSTSIDSDSLSSPVHRILTPLSILTPYCCSVYTQSGEVAGNPTAGRKLMEAISSIPQMDEMKFESILNSTMQVYRHGITSAELGEIYHQFCDDIIVACCFS